LFVSHRPASAALPEVFVAGGSGYVEKIHFPRDLPLAIEAVLAQRRFITGGAERSTCMHGHFGHAAQFFSDEDGFLKSFAWFIARALKSGNPAIVLATKSHQKDLAQILNAQGLDIDGAIRRRTYTPLDVADTLSAIMTNGEIDCTRFLQRLDELIESVTRVAEARHPRVAIAGELAGLLCAAGNWNAAIQLEKTGADLIGRYDVDILCSHPLPQGRREDHALSAICAEHSAVYSR
jgi:hypothetical protein